MKKFAIRAILLVLIAFLIGQFGVVEPLGKLVAQSEDTYIKRWRSFYQNKVDAEILILGSSRVHRHVDAALMTKKMGTKVENVSISDANPGFLRAIFKDYTQHNLPPELLVLCLDIGSFQQCDKVPLPHVFAANAPASTALSQLEDGSRFSLKQLGMLYFKEQLIDASLYPVGPQHVKGYLPRNETWNNDFAKFQDNHPNGKKFIIDTCAIRQAAGLIQDAKSLGTSVVVFYAPEHDVIKPLQTNRENVLEAISSIAGLSQSRFLNFGEGYYLNSRTEMFYNSQHLNTRGAEMFSSDLADSLATMLKCN